MPLSSKRIIEVINEISSPHFNQEDVRKFISLHSKKKKTKGPLLSTKDNRRIDETFFALNSLGYLNYDQKGFSFSPSFDNSGEINIKGSGKAEITYPPFVIEVKKEHVGNAHSGDIVYFDVFDFRSTAFFARVTGIRKRKREIYFARLAKKSSGMLYFRLIDLPGEFYAIAKRENNDPAMDALVKVELTGKQLANNPECTVIERNLDKDAEKFDFDRVCAKFSLPSFYPESGYPDYSLVLEKERPYRVDLTRLFTVTIDGEHAKDFDDAISFEETENKYILYVHIADVSAYVEKNSELDREALTRGNSYYLGSKVIPMLPEILSNNYCSLRADEEKLTLTAEIHYSKEYDVLHTAYHKSIIKVNKRLTYKGADRLAESEDNSPEKELIDKLNPFTRKLKEMRVAQGRLDLDLSDFELVYDSKGRFINIAVQERLISHSIVEECMLAANEAVAKTIKNRERPALYRVHEEISKENWYKLKNFLSLMGIRIKNNKNIAIELQKVVDAHRENDTSYVINMIILKSMMQAYYGIEPEGHFGLGFEDYTHFTSPIRRYSDLVVHRVLKSHIEKIGPVYTDDELIPIGTTISERERVAQKAERELYKIKSCRLMEEVVGENFTGIVSGMTKGGIFVLLKEKPIEGMIPFAQMNDDYYVVDEETFTAYGRRTKREIALGDHLPVTLTRADHVMAQIDFAVNWDETDSEE